MQALYQMDLAATPLNDILAEFESHWIGREVEGEQYLPAEAAFFREVVGGVVREQRKLDPLIDEALAQGWPLKRIETVLRAILRAGAYELDQAQRRAGARRRVGICRRRARLRRAATRPAWSTPCSISSRGNCGPPSSIGQRGSAVARKPKAQSAEDRLIARYFKPLATSSRRARA